jgi:hypothetical protein
MLIINKLKGDFNFHLPFNKLLNTKGSIVPSNSNKEWANLVSTLTGGSRSVANYYDELETTSIHVLTILNDDGKVCATIGLMDVEHEPATEILMDSVSEDVNLENIISSAGFYIMKDGWKIRPGAIFETLVAEYHPELKLKHLLFVPQYQWGEALSKVKLEQGYIYPLLAVGITEEELNFISKNGASALETVWEQNNVNVLDWHRSSSV